MDAAPGANSAARQLLQAQGRLGDDKVQGARSRLEALAQGQGEENTQHLREAAREFESIFLSQMLAPMFKDLSTDGLFGGGHAEKTYRAMLVDEIGKEMSRAGGIGIADSVYEQLLRLQEA